MKSKFSVIIAALIVIILFLASIALSARIRPVDFYAAQNDSTGMIKIYHLSCRDGSSNVIDSIDTTDPRFPDRHIDWRKGTIISTYDKVHQRIFFAEPDAPGEMENSKPLRIHVYEIETRKYFNLPYDNNFNMPGQIMLSPNSKYIFYAYPTENETYDFPPHVAKYDVLVLDGASLREISKKSDLWLAGPFITGNEKYLANIITSDDSKNILGPSYIVYSIPDFQAIDTFATDKIGINGHKMILDFTDEGLLLSGEKTNSAGEIHGFKALILNEPGNKIASKIIEINGTEFGYTFLSADNNEVINLDWPKAKLTRYSLPDGAVAGEMSIPKESVFYFLGDDGQIYLLGHTGPEPEVIQVDYINKKVSKPISLENFPKWAIWSPSIN